MKIDLASQAKAAGAKRKHIELREIKTTKAQERDLARLYVAVVRVWAEGARDGIMPAYSRTLREYAAQDGLVIDSVRDVREEVEVTEQGAVRATFSFEALFRAWSDRLQLWHMRKIVSSLKYSSNVDLSTQISPRDVAETIEETIARNVALVRNVSDQARGRISDAVFRGLQNRTPARDVAKEINSAIQLGRDRSLRIAMDQTQKLSSALDAERQKQLGFTSFEWMHSGKTHYRPEHKERDGKVFKWSSEVGRNDPPGYLPFCGCKAKGVLELE